MELPIPEKVKKLWHLWNLRGSILLSLILQIFLMLFASFRQRSRSKLLLVSIWLAYLLADWIAAVAIGLVAKSQGDHCEQKGNENLSAFWASFLLLHLGGPDSITSFALEDNEFWLRHLLELVLQVLAAAYSFYLTLPKNNLWFPVVLIFVVGTIKFAERTVALYLASLDHFGETVLPEPNPGPDYEEAVAIYSEMRSKTVQIIPTQPETTLITNIENSKDPKFFADGNVLESLDDIKLLKKAHGFFENFKGLIIGILLSSNNREGSRNFFLSRSAAGAFRLVEYELGFIYDVLHTKVVVLRCKIGYILRFVTFCSSIGAYISFYLAEKVGFTTFDTVLTYCLLSGAVGLDIVSVFKLIFSDWTFITLGNCWRKYIPALLLKKGRWSESVSQYNMISYCLDERPMWLFDLAGYLYCKGILQKVKIWLFLSSKPVTNQLKCFIFNELRWKSLRANNLRAGMEACSQRGIWALLQNSSSYNKLKWSVSEFQYAESLLVWHIATEICYQKAKASSDSKTNFNGHGDGESKEICKMLSDYMFYILVAQPTMVAPVMGNWHIVFQDTFAEAKRHFRKHSLSDHLRACCGLLTVDTKFRPRVVKADKSKSVFFDATVLAKELRSLETDPWKLMSRVWVELLSYAAINCMPIVHAHQLSRGGELLTFTWLLMNHLGLGTQFYEQEQQAGTKMVAVK
ncbi:hypothetical protein FNV43_RR07681 [Rhamnella rubrinervis]|uniref:DUF4220 domain-containing protein n=1 Tax=Rhamnella rubrinervis TaxID=2594499 RepID=A0A8K0HFQ7_9ROSA|nr:hypothetical protein FNV43_RR07681 [Rhamnella rubrinervis]